MWWARIVHPHVPVWTTNELVSTSTGCNRWLSLAKPYDRWISSGIVSPPINDFVRITKIVKDFSSLSRSPRLSQLCGTWIGVYMMSTYSPPTRTGVDYQWTSEYQHCLQPMALTGWTLWPVDQLGNCLIPISNFVRITKIVEFKFRNYWTRDAQSIIVQNGDLSSLSMSSRLSLNCVELGLVFIWWAPIAHPTHTGASH